MAGTPAGIGVTAATAPDSAVDSAGAAGGLALDGIGVRFGGLVALDDVSMRADPGAVVGVIGPNGAGKTTLFNVVCGFVRPDAGRLSWQGRPLRARPHQLAGLGIARTLQGVGLFRGLTVVENVMVGANRWARAGFFSALFGLPPSDQDEHRIRESAMQRLEELGVAQYAQSVPSTLPFAVQKRVALARALIGEPRLLLLDEPAGGLGTEDVAELAELVRGLPARYGGQCAVMLVEHHMDLVMEVCHEIVVLDFGRVIARGTPAQIRDNPAVSDAYLGTEAEQ